MLKLKAQAGVGGFDCSQAEFWPNRNMMGCQLVRR